MVGLGALAILGAGVALRLGLCQSSRESELGRIEGLFEDRITPKRKAQEMILDQIHTLEEGYWIADEIDHCGMTDREAKLVSQQISKQRNRVAKFFNYDPWK